MPVITEDEPLDTGFDMIIPFSVSAGGGNICVTAGKHFRAVAEEFERRFSDSPFSLEARDFVFDSLLSILQGSGYSPDRDAFDILTVTYILEDLPEIKRDAELCNVIQLSEAEFSEYENLTDFEPDELFFGNEDQLPLFAVLDGNTVVAVSAVNGNVSDGCAEISADTAEEYRRHGFGRTCVTAISAYLLERGISVKYVCFSDNEASCALARSVGFHEVNICFDAVCFADE